jgi:hypothetical protein
MFRTALGDPKRARVLPDVLDRTPLVQAAECVLRTNPSFLFRGTFTEVELLMATVLGLFQRTRRAREPFDPAAFTNFFCQALVMPEGDGVSLMVLPRVLREFELLELVSSQVVRPYVAESIEPRVLRTRFSSRVLADLGQYHGAAARDGLLDAIAASIQTEFRCEALAATLHAPAIDAPAGAAYAELLLDAVVRLRPYVPEGIRPHYWCAVGSDHPGLLPPKSYLPSRSTASNRSTLHELRFARVRAEPLAVALFTEPLFPANTLVVGWSDPVKNVASIDWQIGTLLSADTSRFSTQGRFIPHTDRLVRYAFPSEG